MVMGISHNNFAYLFQDVTNGTNFTSSFCKLVNVFVVMV